MAALAKQNGMLWSPYQGLFSRNEEGKKGVLITDDADEVSRALLGKSATSDDLGSMESIMTVLGDQAGAQLLAKLRKEPHWKEQHT